MIPYGDNEYIKLFRKMVNWEWYTDVNTKVLFLHCLLRANWKDGSWKGIAYKRGQFITSLNTLAQETGLSIKMVRTALEHLIMTGEVISERQGKGKGQNRIITVLNYDSYQITGKQEANEGQIKGKQGANKGQQYKNNKEDKNYKEEKNNREGKSRAFTAPSIEDISQYCRERNNGVDPQTFFDFYESKGWMVGKNKMKDWKAAVRTWEKREREKPQTKNAALNYEQRKYTDDDIAAIERKKLGIG
jgi:hypothetical protein